MINTPTFPPEVDAYVRMLKSKNQVSVGLGRRAYYAMSPMTPASRLEYAQTFLAMLLSAEGTGQVPPPTAPKSA